MAENQFPAQAASGVPGLDEILFGGLPRGHTYLVKGASGTGKTTLGLQFLLEGARRRESSLYLGLSESAADLRAVADSHRWSLDGIRCHLLGASGAGVARPSRSYTVFEPAEVELEETVKELLGVIEETRASRFVLDSLSEIRLLANNPFRLRREILRIAETLARQQATGLILEVDGPGEEMSVGETIAHGVIELEQLSPAYGGDRRRLRVRKLRGSRCVGGYHDFRIREGGLDIFPRLVAAQFRDSRSSETVGSGVAALDRLLGGGLDRGTAVACLGPAGAGKSTLVQQFLCAAGERGERSVIYSFDESPANLVRRAETMDTPLPRLVREGPIRIVPVDPAELTPGEFAHVIRRDVEERGARLVAIDSLNGYVAAMLEERFLLAHLHELLTYLGEKGVITLMTVAQHGLVSDPRSPFDVSYIADTVLLVRFFEAAGSVRHALSVIKKRTGYHEKTIRELRLGRGGVQVGEPLTGFHGLLTGSPRYIGGPLLGDDNRDGPRPG